MAAEVTAPAPVPAPAPSSALPEEDRPSIRAGARRPMTGRAGATVSSSSSDEGLLLGSPTAAAPPAPTTTNLEGLLKADMARAEADAFSPSARSKRALDLGAEGRTDANALLDFSAAVRAADAAAEAALAGAEAAPAVAAPPLVPFEYTIAVQRGGLPFVGLRLAKPYFAAPASSSAAASSSVSRPAVVEAVHPDGQAAQMGVEEGDELLLVGGEDVATNVTEADLRARVRGLSDAGGTGAQVVRLRFRRPGVLVPGAAAGRAAADALAAVVSQAPLGLRDGGGGGGQGRGGVASALVLAEVEAAAA